MCIRDRLLPWSATGRMDLEIRLKCHSCEGVCSQGHSLLLKTGRGRIPNGGRRTACRRRNRDYRSHNRRAAHDRGGNSCGFETSGNDQKGRTLLHQDRHKNPSKRQTFPLAKGGASTAIITHSYLGYIQSSPRTPSSGAAFSIITQLSYITIFEALAPFFTM